jgi:hypothetical protein
MGNFSSDPQLELAGALDRDYCRVRFQQGKPALDRDLNLAADLAGPQRLAAHYIGSGITGAGSDFAITALNVGANEFAIQPGRCLVNGLEAVLRAATTYRTQPNTANVAPLPAGTSHVYLRTFEREVTAAQDPLLGNATDVTFETAVRNKVDWEVRVSAAVITAPDHFLLARITTAPAGIEDRRRLGVNAATLADRVNTAHDAAGALRANAVGTAQIAAQAVTQEKLALGAIALAQLKNVARFNGSLTIAAGADGTVTSFLGNRAAKLLVSVTVGSASGVVSWQEFVSRSPAQTVRGVRVRNEGPTAVTVDVEVHELLAT